MQTQRTDLWTWGERKGGTNGESSIETFTLPHIKQIASGNLLYDSGNPKLVLCDYLEVWEGEGGGREV